MNLKNQLNQWGLHAFNTDNLNNAHLMGLCKGHAGVREKGKNQQHNSSSLGRSDSLSWVSGLFRGIILHANYLVQIIALFRCADSSVQNLKKADFLNKNI